MSFVAKLQRAREVLEQQGRLSVRALRRELELDDGELDALVDELVEIQRVAARDGRALVWKGEPNDPPTTVTAESSLERDPRDYTPKHLADKILQSKSALEGERKQVSVLFADVKGSMELSEQIDPEEWHAILDRFFQILTDGVHRFEGTVNQYTGDGIMALFGAPIAHEDHAQRACYAALHLRDELRLYTDELRQRGVVFSTRMGLNSGEVVVGKIGDDLRMDYTAQGHTVGLAQRVETLAAAGSVCLTGATADRVSGYFALRGLGESKLKGSSEPVRVFELMGPGELRSRFDVSRARGLSTFVGREREMAQLGAALERAQRGSLQLVGVVAEAGTGKSRLLHEFGESCRSKSVRLVRSSCPPYGTATPLAFHMDGVRSYFGILEQDTQETARSRIAAQMSEMGLDADVPFLLDFIGIDEASAPAAPHDSDARQRELLRILGRMNDRLTELYVALYEDLHWIDSASEAVYVEINRIEREEPVLHVLSFRPEYRPPQADWPNYEEIRLKPLTPESTAQLLRDLLGPEASGRGLETLIQARAAGNPFFVEEIVQSLAESRHLRGVRGAYQLVGSPEAIDVPDSVQAVLAARIDRLDERAKQVLQAAAVIGTEFPAPLLEAAVALPARDLDPVLHELVNGAFLYQQAAYPEVEYAFKHPLTQQVAYESQLRGPRRRAHGTVARLLEKRYPDRLGEKAALIAHHWEEAGEAPAAARWHARAADWVGMNDVRAALDHWRRVRALVDPEQAELGVTASSQILGLGWRLGASEQECERVFEEGRALAERAADLPSLASLTANYGGFRGITVGITHDWLRYGRDSIRIADETGDPALRCGARAHLVYAYRHAGLVEPGIAACDELEELLHGDPHLGADLLGYSPLVGVGHVRSALQVYRGDAVDFRPVFSAHRQLALDHGYPEMVVWIRWDQAKMAAALRDQDGVASWARETRELAEGQGNVADLMARVTLAITLGFAGDAQAKLETAGDALQTIRETRALRYAEAEALQLVAEAHVALGQAEAARRAAAEATALMAERGTYGWSLSAFGSLARAQLALGEPASEVERTLDEYAAAIRHTGMRVFERELAELRALLPQGSP